MNLPCSSSFLSQWLWSPGKQTSWGWGEWYLLPPQAEALMSPAAHAGSGWGVSYRAVLPCQYAHCAPDIFLDYVYQKGVWVGEKPSPRVSPVDQVTQMSEKDEFTPPCTAWVGLTTQLPEGAQGTKNMGEKGQAATANEWMLLKGLEGGKMTASGDSGQVALVPQNSHVIPRIGAFCQSIHGVHFCSDLDADLFGSKMPVCLASSPLVAMTGNQ